jgi:2-desacetyl-2-hydroxyethyl bacteriochlorophyllide A dehydrogenase
MSMKAAVVHTGGAFEITDVPVPTPGPGQVLARPVACGICGSDLHLVELLRGMPADPAAPGIVLGHEFCVEVVEAGPDTESPVPPGRLACSVPYLAAAGTQILGTSPTAPGAFADYVLLDAGKLVPVPDGLGPDAASLTEPLAVGRHAAGLGNLERGRPAVIIGCGPVGLAVLVALKAAGHGPVLVSDPSPLRRAAAERLGADIVVDPGERSPFATWDELGVDDQLPSPLLTITGARQAPVTVFECVGIPGLIQQVIDGVPIGSRVVVVGVCMQPDTIVPVTGIVKEVELVFSFAYRPDEFSAVLRDIGDGAIDAESFITRAVSLDAVGEAFDALASDPAEIKILVRPNGR